VLVVLVELSALLRRYSVEVGEQVRDGGLRLTLRRRTALQVVDDRFRVDFLLDVERRDVDDEIGLKWTRILGPFDRLGV
jgi:hypothetical protein